MIVIISASFSLISVPQNQFFENILISSPNCSSKSHLPWVIIGHQLKTFSRNPSKLPYITFAAFFFISSKWVAFHDPCLPSSTWLKTTEKHLGFLPNNSCISCNIRCQFSTQHLLLWWPCWQLRLLLASSFQLFCCIERGVTSKQG